MREFILPFKNIERAPVHPTKVSWKIGWRKYYRKVWKLTESVAHLIPGIEKRGFTDHHIDHKISVWYGYKNDIPAETIGGLSNLQMLHYKENIRKGRKAETKHE